MISGLGADREVFQNLVFPESISITHIEWIKHHPHETLPEYAARLSIQIDAESPFAILGVSFGGMIAVEIAKLHRPDKVIVISSAVTSESIPWYYKWAGVLQLPRLIPGTFLTSANALTYRFFGANSPASKRLLKTTLAKTDVRFLRWALLSIVYWKNTIRPDRLYQLHGDADHILPCNFTHGEVRVRGGHLAVFTNAEQVSTLLNSILCEAQD